MNNVIEGTGYIGLVSGTCFTEMVANVMCVNFDTHNIDKPSQNDGTVCVFVSDGYK